MICDEMQSKEEAENELNGVTTIPTCQVHLVQTLIVETNVKLVEPETHSPRNQTTRMLTIGSNSRS
jgi:hypothetical protein